MQVNFTFENGPVEADLIFLSDQWPKGLSIHLIKKKILYDAFDLKKIIKERRRKSKTVGKMEGLRRQTANTKTWMGGKRDNNT